jgi:hypothetical protein
MFTYTVIEIGTECDDLVCLYVSEYDVQYSKQRLTSTLLMNGMAYNIR